MAVILSNLLRERQPERVEENLQQGRVWVFSPGTMYNNFYVAGGICWVAPADGVVDIEVWGAGGSGARMCCCGYGLPGNAGAYVKKTICMTAGQSLCGYTGESCRNEGSLCFRGCSDASGVTWTGCAVSDGATSGCICARGGRGGISFCSTTPSAWCCYYANGFCGTQVPGDNCGIICNHCPGGWEALGYGGDINCCGPISCAGFFGCYPMCPCQFYYYIPTPSGMFSCGGQNRAIFRTENDNRFSNWSGQGRHQHINSMSGMSKSPRRGIPFSYCWRSDRACGCYEHHGRMPYYAVGTGGQGPTPCPGVRDDGTRGGWGAIRIRFIQS